MSAATLAKLDALADATKAIATLTTDEVRRVVTFALRVRAERRGTKGLAASYWAADAAPWMHIASRAVDARHALQVLLAEVEERATGPAQPEGYRATHAALHAALAPLVCALVSVPDEEAHDAHTLAETFLALALDATPH